MVKPEHERLEIGFCADKADAEAQFAELRAEGFHPVMQAAPHYGVSARGERVETGELGYTLYLPAAEHREAIIRSRMHMWQQTREQVEAELARR
jgi:hypothetical protein